MEQTAESLRIPALRGLLSQLPSKHLTVGLVAGDKPGVLCGDSAVCRARDTDEGRLYAALFVEVVNVLPALLTAAEASLARQPGLVMADAGGHSDAGRDVIESKISQTLALLPGFKSAATQTWSKLLYAALQPWLAVGESTHPESAVVDLPRTASHSKGDQQLRLDAVVDFCDYMLKHVDAEQRPSEYVLESWANDWGKANNGATASQLNGGEGQ